MDMMESGKEISEEMTRESLIAISYSEAMKDLSLRPRPKISSAENVIKAVNDNYRSKLITMFYTESPDTKVEPVACKL
ncbi:hypothetical protein P3L10_028332 [Capsicum annuum]